MKDREYFMARQRVRRRTGFYRHLRIYLFVVGLNMVAGFMSGNFLGWYPLAFFWGIGLGVHYLSVFGWPELREEDSRYDRRREERRRRKAWRDRDLV